VLWDMVNQSVHVRCCPLCTYSDGMDVALIWLMVHVGAAP
jgi:hypothetical protein